MLVLVRKFAAAGSENDRGTLDYASSSRKRTKTSR
jgi:hypothetical protein